MAKPSGAMHNQDYQIMLKSGLAANINATATVNAAVEAEPHYTTDTETLYVYDGALNRPVAAQIPVISKSADYTATNGDCVILVSGTTTITLPPVSANKVFYIKNIGTGTVTVDGNGSETIDGQLTQVINAQYTTMCIVSDGSAWHII